MTPFNAAVSYALPFDDAAVADAIITLMVDGGFLLSFYDVFVSHELKPLLLMND